MKLFRRSIAAMLLAISLCTTAQAEPVRFATMNLRWYGLGGQKEDPGAPETRDEALRKYLRTVLARADVMVFQEIVDTTRFRSEVVGPEYKCRTYGHPSSMHQHVMLCYRNTFTLEKEADDENYVIDEVALGRFRPALNGVLKDANGNRLAHIIGVHLKAHPAFTKLRLRQAELIADSIHRHDDGVPVVVLGDFNTHVSPDQNDTALISRIFERAGLKELRSDAWFTYRTPRFGGKFDRIWASSHATPLSPVTVGSGCNDEGDIERYNREISDHCSVAVTLEL